MPLSPIQAVSFRPQQTPLSFGNAKAWVPIARSIGTEVAGDIAWIALANLLLPLVLPIAFVLTLGGALLSRHLGLKYDKKTDLFINFQKGHPERAEIKKRIRQIEAKVENILRKPLWLLPQRIQESASAYLKKTIRFIHHSLRQNDRLIMFLKVPASKLGRLIHVAKCCLLVLAMILKKRLSKGLLGRAFTFLLGASTLNRVRHIIQGAPSTFIKQGVESTPKLKIDAVEKAFTKITQHFQR